jgi:hypothetical protein
MSSYADLAALRAQLAADRLDGSLSMTDEHMSNMSEASPNGCNG